MSNSTASVVPAALLSLILRTVAPFDMMSSTAGISENRESHVEIFFGAPAAYVSLNKELSVPPTLKQASPKRLANPSQ